MKTRTHRRQAEYVWLGGKGEFRGKTRVVERVVREGDLLDSGKYPRWSFDGSSTGQAEGNASDCLLQPVRVVIDPFRPIVEDSAAGYNENVLVLCEVRNADGTPHQTNTRHLLEPVATATKTVEPLFAFEQEYTLFQAGGGHPLAWSTDGRPPIAGQGPYYCGVGTANVYGRALYDDHLAACIAAGLTISGGNLEVMPGQAEFQVGPCDPLAAGDELLLARYILERVAERHQAMVSYDPKPLPEWNGAGCHTNFSTSPMRAVGGMAEITAACERLSRYPLAHIIAYGDLERNKLRLTGKHETCAWDQFRFGVGDRGASIRIPAPVATDGKGYLEDRRPPASCDPYLVMRAILATTCLNQDPSKLPSESAA